MYIKPKRNKGDYFSVRDREFSDKMFDTYVIGGVDFDESLLCSRTLIYIGMI
jgi:hypothetical protein